MAVILVNACANIAHPTGGEKDVTPPQLLSVIPADSQLNTKVTVLELRFDEYVTVSNASTEVQVSPLLPFPPTIEGINKKVSLKIPDSLLQEHTTYRITFGNAIADLHEGNVFSGYNYIFSTGNYFDSLQINGKAINAFTGISDTGAMVLLYPADKSDSIVVREKPMYAVKTNSLGSFSFQGLPDKNFKIYALRDKNNNLMYDGGEEMIAFADSIIRPVDSFSEALTLFLFAENDSVYEKTSISPSSGGRGSKIRNTAGNAKTDAAAAFTYNVMADTSNIHSRTVDVTKPLRIMFNKPIATLNEDRVNLSYDSSDITMEAPIKAIIDTHHQNILLIETLWKENTVYTLRLLKNFALDSSGKEALPSKHIFRTKEDADYAKLHVHLPTKYYDTQYLFTLYKENERYSQQQVTDTNLHFYKLEPATYTMRIVVDANKNGKWDYGHLFEKRQPEKVIPNNTPVILKAGWENTVDFEASTTVDRPGSLRSRRGLGR